ncbi:MAG: LysM peptidoglycan-binding domain-containing protein, partial [Parabacteroides sp.]|nr:LysM peptidoglycan-binding domain-containing protein [Parabacteroides sp.]
LCPLQTSLPLATDTVMVNQALHLQQVSEVLQLDLATLRALNPQYRRDIIPGNTRPSALKLPAAATYAFVGQEDTIYKHRMEEYLANIPIHNEEAQNSKATTRERITHVVLQGENLYTIANRYGVTAKDIRKWNGLGSNRVAKGKRLKLYVDNGGIAFAAAKPTTSTTKSTASSSTAKTAITTKAAISTNGKEFIAYTVKSGDSLYSIAKKYPGVSTKDLQQANGLKGSDIRPGQVLKIPVG